MRVRRIRITGGPWPERIGLTGHITQPTTAAETNTYPFHGKARREVVVFLNDDPLNGPRTRYADHHPTWTCVLDLADFEYVDRQPEMGVLGNPCEQCGAEIGKQCRKLPTPGLPSTRTSPHLARRKRVTEGKS